jgi:hypothetical protein
MAVCEILNVYCHDCKPMGVSSSQNLFSKLFYRFQRLNMSFEKVKISLMPMAVHVKIPVRNLVISDLL